MLRSVLVRKLLVTLTALGSELNQLLISRDDIGRLLEDCSCYAEKLYTSCERAVNDFFIDKITDNS